MPFPADYSLPSGGRCVALRPQRHLPHVLTLLCLGLTGCPTAVGPAPGPPAQPLVTANASGGAAAEAAFPLVDVVAAAGVEFSYRNGREAGHGALVEAVGGGAGVLDFDGDGWPDLFFTGGGGFGPERQIHGRPPALFRNLGDWRFAAVAAAARIDSALFFNHTCCCADYDNDGFIDVALTGYGGLQLFHNLGDGTFLESRGPAGWDDSAWSTAGAWADIDGDGALDFYVAHFANWSFDNHPHCAGWQSTERDTCPPIRFDPLPDLLYRSQADGSFLDVSETSHAPTEGRGLGVLAADLDHDGDVDFYVANDMTANFLLLNDGHGVFAEEGMQRGAAIDERAEPNGSMGVELLDYDGDGWSDIWVTNFVGEMHAMYHNLGRAEFECASSRLGIGVLDAQFVGWGTAACDLDRDGDEDLLFVNGHTIYHAEGVPHLQRPVLLLNQRPAGRFVSVDFPAESYFGSVHAGRGLALGDLDRDGDQDLAISNLNEPVAVLRNDAPATGRQRRLRLVGRSSNRDAIGARLVLHTSAGDQLRHVKGGGSFASHCDLTVDWGIAEGVELQGLSVWWPSGIFQRIEPPAWPTSGLLIEPDEHGEGRR